jgi:hypothetical protein
MVGSCTHPGRIIPCNQYSKVKDMRFAKIGLYRSQLFLDRRKRVKTGIAP